VNVADAPGEGDFTLPAVLRRGDLTVAVSTAGGSPALAAAVRDRVAELLGGEWAETLAIVAALRRKKLTFPQKNLTASEKTEYDREILRRLLEGGLPSLVAGGRIAEIDRLLVDTCGEGCSLADLGIGLPKGKT
jgi:precorrin-2 dehydrogenase/sirohydrochlorin ferrochelatase